MRHNFDLYADPYSAAMKRYERSAWGYGAIAAIALVGSLMIGSVGEEPTVFAPIIAQVKYVFGGGLLIASTVACLLSLSFPRFFVCQRMGFMLPVFPDAAL